MARIDSHRDLIVWQKSMDLAVITYQLSDRFPERERYALSAQLRRAVVSVPTNIAEGTARGSRKDYANFLAIGKGSLREAETCLLLAIRLKFLQEVEAQPALALITEISKMLTVLRGKLADVL